MAHYFHFTADNTCVDEFWHVDQDWSEKKTFKLQVYLIQCFCTSNSTDSSKNPTDYVTQQMYMLFSCPVIKHIIEKGKKLLEALWS